MIRKLKEFNFYNKKVSFDINDISCICIMENHGMKLKEWADRTGVAYLTAYRWFKAGKFPVSAYQTESGTIIVEDEGEQEMLSLESTPKDAMSLFLKKTIEYSISNATVEDFAAWIISTFTLTLGGSKTTTKRKPTSEDARKHFAQFIPKRDKPKAQMIIAQPEDLDHLIDDDISAKDLIEGMAELGCGLVKTAPVDGVAVPVDSKLFQELSQAIKSPGEVSNTILTGTTGGAFNRITTPQNYANSTESSTTCNLSISETTYDEPIATDSIESVCGPTDDFKQIKKELASAEKTRSILRKVGEKDPVKHSGKGRGRPRKIKKVEE